MHTHEDNHFYDSTFNLLEPDYNTDDIKVLEQKIIGTTDIATVIDKEKNKFIVKQKENNLPESALIPIIETITGYIAETNDIPINKVRIIPTGVYFPGKKYLNMPASLHTFISGKLVSNMKGKFFNFSQFSSSEGLSFDLICIMALHEDLPRIIAFNTFIGNTDQSTNNLFYDPISQRFYGIDLEFSFKTNRCRNTCNNACKFLKDVISSHNTYILLPSEINGLCIFRDTVKGILENHTPKELHLLLDLLIEQSHVCADLKSLKTCIQAYKNQITQNFIEANALVKLIDTFIASQKQIYND